jgi:hypothetical protein
MYLPLEITQSILSYLDKQKLFELYFPNYDIYFYQYFSKSYKCDDVDKIKLLIKLKILNKNDLDFAMKMATVCNSPELVKYLYQKQNINITDFHIHEMVTIGNLELIKFVHNSGIKYDPFRTIYAAVDHIEIVKFINENISKDYKISEKNKEYLTNWTYVCKRLDILYYLTKHAKWFNER